MFNGAALVAAMISLHERQMQEEQILAPLTTCGRDCDQSGKVEDCCIDCEHRPDDWESARAIDIMALNP